jgi:hypothetical protein
MYELLANYISIQQQNPTVGWYAALYEIDTFSNGSDDVVSRLFRKY